MISNNYATNLHCTIIFLRIVLIAYFDIVLKNMKLKCNLLQYVANKLTELLTKIL